MHNNPANQKCLVSTHRRGIIKQEVMSREKALGLSGDDVDLQINVQTGEGTYKTKEGKRQKFPSLGTRAWKLFWDAAWAAERQWQGYRLEWYLDGNWKWNG